MSFSQETLDFLFENKLNDSRAWFHEHHDTYEKVVVAPLKALAAQLEPTMLQIDPLMITTPRRVLSRINRDTRFTHDKSLYRSNMWLTFGRDKHQFGGVPCFYFEIGLYGFSYGCGYYQMPPEVLATLRELIKRDDPAFRKAFDAYNSQSVFELYGDMYKKSKHPDYPAELKLWLDRKNFGFGAESDDFEMLYSDHLGEFLCERLKWLEAPYELMLKAVSTAI